MFHFEVKWNKQEYKFKDEVINVLLLICWVKRTFLKKHWTNAVICRCLEQYLPHLKHILCHFSPPATRSSAAYTDLPHLGHLGFSTGLKGILNGGDYFLDLKSNRNSISDFENHFWILERIIMPLIYNYDNFLGSDKTA